MLRQGKNATTGAGDVDVGFDGTGKVLYNDHVLGTPPLVVGPSSFETRREASSFLPGSAPLSPSMFFPSGCATCASELAHALSRSTNVTADGLELWPSPGLIVLFGQDLLHFDQLMWPITSKGAN
jgi:hypothetical protein